MTKLSIHTKNTAGLNAGTTTLAEKILLEKINVSEVFENLIPIKESDLEAITQNMRESGFDILHPVAIWKEENVLLDGHTRFAAAKEAGLKEIYCYKKSFEDEKEAIAFAINEQLRRRNLDDVGKILLVEKLDNLKTRGVSGGGKSSCELAKTLGVGSRTVEKARSVLKHADEDTLQAVKAGELSINKADEKIKESKKKQQEKEDDFIAVGEENESEENPFDFETDFDESVDFSADVVD